MVTNWRSWSLRWAVVTIAQRGLPSAVCSIDVDVERRPGHPRPERRRGEQAVEPHRQRHAVLRREELVELEHAELADRRLLDHADERRQVEAAAGRPLVEDEVRQQDVLAARQRIGLDADQAEQAGDEALDLVADDLGVGDIGGRLQRADDVERRRRHSSPACRS